MRKTSISKFGEMTFPSDSIGSQSNTFDILYQTDLSWRLKKKNYLMYG